MSDEAEIKKPQFELTDDGEVRFNRKGKSTLLAKYNAETGVLTFESVEADFKYRTQICRAVIEDIEGKLTGNIIRVYAIHNRPVDKKRRDEPPRPRWSPSLGDKTPEYVRWLFRWRPQAAYVRYQVLLDSNGEPRRAHCVRIEQGLLQKRTSDKPMLIRGDGRDALGETVTEDENGILAHRQTCMTFSPAEMVDASDREAEAEDDEPLAGGEPEETASAGAGAKGRGKKDEPANE